MKDFENFTYKNVRFELKDGFDCTYSDYNKVPEPKIFGNIKKQKVFMAVKPAYSNSGLSGGTSSALGSDINEAEKSLFTLLTKNNSVNCARVDDDLISVFRR